MAALFWVGGSTAYDGVTNRLATTTGGTATVAVISAVDTVTFDANSPAAAAVTTSAAISCTTLTLAAGFTGSLTMSNVLTVSGAMAHTQGGLNTNGQTCSFGSYSSSNINTRALTLGASSITVTNGAAAAVWNIGTNTGMSLSAASSTITFSGTATGAGAIFSGGGFTYGTLNFTGAGIWQITGANTITNFTRTGTAAKGDSLAFNNNQTCTGTFTVGGNTTQGVNRLLVQSNAIGSVRSVALTGAAVVINGDVDFMDITLSGAPSWTNTGAAFVGNCGGNSALITSNVTTPAAQTRSGVAGNWSTAANWTSRVPLPQDSVTVNAGASGTITQDMPRAGASIDFTGFTGTAALNSISFSVFGGLTFDSGMAVTVSSTVQMTLGGRSTFGVTSKGKAQPPTTITAPTGTYTFQDNWVTHASSTTALVLTLGTLTISGTSTVTVDGTGSGTKFSMTGGTLNMGNGTWTISVSNGGVNWSVTAGTLNPQGSTINLTDTGISGKTFAGGGRAYNNLSIAGGGTGTWTFTGANTFANLLQITGGTKSIVWPGSTTTTFTNGGNFGNSSNVITMTASAGSATLAFGTQVNADFLNLTNIIAATTIPAYAGPNSTNGGGNTNWIFTAAPSISQSTLMLLGVGS